MVFLGRQLERNLNMPIPFLDLDMADLIWVEKDTSESRTIPKSLCLTTCITGKLVKRITG